MVNPVKNVQVSKIILSPINNHGDGFNVKRVIKRFSNTIRKGFTAEEQVPESLNLAAFNNCLSSESRIS